MKLVYSIYCFLIIATLSAQKKLTYNAKGELAKQEYQQIIKLKKYQAISAFDTVSTKPLLVYAIFIKNNKFGILDDSGKEITPAIYDGIEGMNISYTTVMFGFHENFPVKIGKKYGLITNKGKVVLPMEYDYIYCQEKKSIDRKHKKEVVKDSLIIANKGDDELHFSPQGKLINRNAKYPSEIEEPVKDYRDYEIPKSTISEKYLETSTHGKIIKKLDNGYAIIEAKVDNKYYYQGLVELATDKLILPAVHSYLIVSQKDRLIALKDKQYNLYNTKGELILKETFEGIDSFNLIYKIKKGNKIAIFDKDLNQKTDFIYDSFSSSGPDLMVARKDLKEGVINAFGKEIIPFEYDKVEAYLNRYGAGFAFFRVTKNNKQGFLSTKGEPLTEIIYDEIYPECTVQEPSYSSEPLMPTDFDYDQKYNKYFVYKKDSKFGLLDNNFKALIPNNYEFLKKSFHENYVIIGKQNANKKTDLGILNIKTNTQIVPFEYQSIKHIGNSYFTLYKQSQMAVCNESGKIIIPMEPATDYYYNLIYKGLSVIENRKNDYYIDQQGTIIKFINP